MTVTVERTASPADVHTSLARHLLVDGFDLVLDLERSHGSWLVDARDGTEYLDLFTFFASNALYPIEIMPTWLQVVSQANPLTYLVDALRGLLIGTPAHLALDFAVLLGSTAVGIVVAGALLGRLVR